MYSVKLPWLSNSRKNYEKATSQSPAKPNSVKRPSDTHVSSLSFFFRNSRTPLCQSSENGVRTCQIADFQPDLWRNMVWYGMFYWHFTDIFFYKKPIYKKPRATEAENLRNWRATFLAPKKLFYWETENRQFFTKIGPKITKKSEN